MFPVPQVSELVSIDEYIKDHIKSKKKFKSMTDKKKYLKGKGVTLVKHPKTKNEMVPVEKEMHMLTGKRVAAARIKETDHTGDRSGAREAAEKASSAVNMEDRINTKAGEVHV